MLTHLASDVIGLVLARVCLSTGMAGAYNRGRRCDEHEDGDDDDQPKNEPSRGSREGGWVKDDDRPKKERGRGSRHGGWDDDDDDRPKNEPSRGSRQGWGDDDEDKFKWRKDDSWRANPKWNRGAGADDDSWARWRRRSWSDDDDDEEPKRGRGRGDDVDDLRQRLAEHEELVAWLQQQVEQMQVEQKQSSIRESLNVWAPSVNLRSCTCIMLLPSSYLRSCTLPHVLGTRLGHWTPRKQT